MSKFELFERILYAAISIVFSITSIVLAAKTQNLIWFSILCLTAVICAWLFVDAVIRIIYRKIVTKFFYEEHKPLTVKPKKKIIKK